MLQVQEAVKRSLTTFAELFAETDLQDVRLEEASLTPDDSSWLVTVSYRNPDYNEEQENAPVASGLAAWMGNTRSIPKRLQKTIKLRAETGEFVGVKAEWEN